jgi:hypothetical protein
MNLYAVNSALPFPRKGDQSALQFAISLLFHRRYFYGYKPRQLSGNRVSFRSSMAGPKKSAPPWVIFFSIFGEIVLVGCLGGC